MENNEKADVKIIEFNCAMGIVLCLMHKGLIFTKEYDAIENRLKKRYGIEGGSVA